MSKVLAGTPKETIEIPAFGSIDKGVLDLDNKAYRIYKMRLSDDSIKAICDALSFQARFDSPSVLTAYVDIQNDEGLFVFAITKNTRPQSLALRYSAERWFCLEDNVKDPGVLTPAISNRPSLKTLYHADDLSEDTRLKLSQALGLNPDLQPKIHIRINFKEAVAYLIVESSVPAPMPLQAVLVSTLGSEGTVVSSSGNASDSAFIKHTEPRPAPSATDNERDKASTADQNNTKDSSETPSQRKKTKDNMSDPIKYDTYSQSEVDALIKKQAESITASITTKVNSQQKSINEAMKNQEYSFNQTLQKLTQHIDEANEKLQKTTAELNSMNSEQMDSFKKSLSKELDEFKTHINKNVLPGLKLLDARLEQLAEARKESRETGASNPGLLSGAIVAIVIILAVNLGLVWYALDRIATLEKSHVELLNRNQARDDVPLPDLMKEQIDKENASKQAVPQPAK